MGIALLRTYNPLVLGSNPSGPTNKFGSPALQSVDFRFAHFPQKEVRELLFTALSWRQAILFLAVAQACERGLGSG